MGRPGWVWVLLGWWLLGAGAGVRGEEFPAGSSGPWGVAFAWGNSASYPGPSGDGGTPSREEARRRVKEILERHTVFHWGEDCLVWMVHYPQELVDPWVALESEKRGLSPEERAQYRASFVRDLRLGEMEPVLFTVYVFGDSPVSFHPFKERVLLVEASGDVPPLSVESKLDGTLTGIVQGLVFFPKQVGGNFTVKVRPGDAPEFLSFAFKSAPEEPRQAASPDAPVQVVVAQVPPLPSPVSTPVPPEKPSRRALSPSPIKPTPTVEPPPDFLVLPPVATLGPSPAPAVEVAGPLSPEGVFPSPLSEDPKSSSPGGKEGVGAKESPSPEKERLVENFLKLWVAGEGEKMYALLSEQSRTLMNAKDFASQARQHSFRWALRDGHRLAWIDGETVRVSAAQKLLVMRVLKTHILRLVREQGGWRVVW